MTDNRIPEEVIAATVDQTLKEDLGSGGDITSAALFSDDDSATAEIRSKSQGVLSGVYLLEPVFSRLDSRLRVAPLLSDGSAVLPGAVIATVTGPIRGILAGERTVLNFLQRLSGIATVTSRFAAALSGTSCRLLDTRKTTPLLRYFEKAAVVHGGGCNHRFGLFDMMLIKDTHVKRSGGVAPALERAIAYRSTIGKPELQIEVEVQSEREFEEALRFRPDRIMLDNMTVAAMRRCVELRAAQYPEVALEASGNVTLDTVGAIAATGVDYISSGALTHSAPALDIHLIIR